MNRAMFIWAVVLTMGAFNFAIRFLPLAIVSRLRLPRPLERWLSFVPVTVLATIVTSEVVLPGGSALPPLSNPYLLAAVPTAFTYWKSRSFIAATLVGIVAFLLLRSLVG